MIRKCVLHLKSYCDDEYIQEFTEYVNGYCKDKISSNQLMGTLEDDSDATEIYFSKVSHVVTKIDIVSGYIMIEYKILDTPDGKIAKSLIESNIFMHVVPRINKNPNGTIRSVHFDLAMGKKQAYREEQLKRLLGE
jgi:hypothetical protein